MVGNSHSKNVASCDIIYCSGLWAMEDGLEVDDDEEEEDDDIISFTANALHKLLT